MGKSAMRREIGNVLKKDIRCCDWRKQIWRFWYSLESEKGLVRDWGSPIARTEHSKALFVSDFGLRLSCFATTPSSRQHHLPLWLSICAITYTLRVQAYSSLVARFLRYQSKRCLPPTNPATGSSAWSTLLSSSTTKDSCHAWPSAAHCSPTRSCRHTIRSIVVRSSPAVWMTGMKLRCV